MRKRTLWLSGRDYLKAFELVPRVAINLLVNNKDGKILLTKRKIPPFKGFWHYSGSMLLKNELIEDCFRRVAKDELGFTLDKVSKPKLLGVFNDIDDDPRGHFVDIIYLLQAKDVLKIKSTDQTAEVKFFKKLPKKMFIAHRRALERLGYK